MTVLLMGLIGVGLLAVTLIFGDVFGDSDLQLFDSDVFSTAALAGFVGAFGFAGAATLQLTGIGLLASLVGLLCGSAFAWLAVRLSRFLKAGEQSSSFETETLIGTDAKVITDIPAEGFGEVHLTAAGQTLKITAAAEVPLPAGTRVWVSGVISPTAVQVSPSHPELGS